MLPYLPHKRQLFVKRNYFNTIQNFWSEMNKLCVTSVELVTCVLSCWVSHYRLKSWQLSSHFKVLAKVAQVCDRAQKITSPHSLPLLEARDHHLFLSYSLYHFFLFNVSSRLKLRNRFESSEACFFISFAFYFLFVSIFQVLTQCLFYPRSILQ